jgi:hypothetical protein
MEIELDEQRQGAVSALITTLTLLSLPADEQVRVTEPGCVPCDLAEEFESASAAYRGAWEMSPEEDAALTAVEAQVAMAGSEEYECFDSSVLLRPSWQMLRARARTALEVFGWTGHEVEPFQQIAPGVFHRPPIVLRHRLNG